jgi:2-enoate reductase
VGCETALWLAQQDKDVTIVEMLPALMAGGLPVPNMNKWMLLDLLAYNKVKVLTGACAREIKDDSVVIADDDGERTLPAESVVLAAGLLPENGLYQALSQRLPRVYAPGDGREPRNIMGAVWDGYEVGRLL